MHYSQSLTEDYNQIISYVIKWWLVVFSSVSIFALYGCGGNRSTNTDNGSEPILTLQVATETIVSDVLYEFSPDSTWATSIEGTYDFRIHLNPNPFSTNIDSISFDCIGQVYAHYESELVIWKSGDQDTGVVWNREPISSVFQYFPVYFPLPSLIHPNTFIVNDYIRGRSQHVEDLRLRLINRTSYNCLLLDRQVSQVVFYPPQSSMMLVGPVSGNIVEIGHDGSTIKEWSATDSWDWRGAAFYNNKLLILYQDESGIRLTYLGPEDTEAEVIAFGNNIFLTGIAAIGSSIFGLSYSEETEHTTLFEFKTERLFLEGSFTSALVDSVDLGPYSLGGPIGITSSGELLAKKLSQGKEQIVLINADGNILGQWKTPFRYITAAFYNGSKLFLHAISVHNEAVYPDYSGEVGYHIWMPPVIWSVEATKSN